MSLFPRHVPQDQLRPFGSLHGADVPEIVLRSPGGIEARIIPYGAIVRDLSLPMPDGRRQGIVLGYDSLDGYLADPNYFGALVGRFANRIAGGRFTLDGTAYDLDRNEGGTTTLHGGRGGFSTRLWAIEQLTETAVTLALVSPEGDQGFPGALTALCRYEVSDRSGLRVEVSARTTRPTPVSLAQHSYFTLGARDVRDLRLTVHADRYTPVDGANIPTGALSAVGGTVFVALLYLLTSTAILLLLPADAASASNSPFADAIARGWGEAGALFAALGIAISAAGYVNANVLVCGELGYSMALRREMPAFLARTIGENTPLNAQLTGTALASGLILANMSRGTADLFTFMALLTACATLWLYLASALGALKQRPGGVALVAVLGGLGFTLFAFYGSGWEANLWSLALLAAGAVLYALMRRLNRSTWAAAVSAAAPQGSSP